MAKDTERPFVSVGTKSAIWLSVVLAATGMATAVELSSQTRDRLVEGKLTAATMVADLFAASAAPALDFEDDESLAQEAEKLRTNPEIEYAAVFKPAADEPAAVFDRSGHGALPKRPARQRMDVLPGHIDVTRILTAPDGRPLGALLLRVSLARENERFAEARKRIIQYTGIVTLLAALGLLAISRRLVTTPLRGLARAARKLEQGRAEPVPVRANDEIGQLGTAFNAMAAAIVDRERRLEELNRELFQLLDGMRQAILVFAEGGVLGAVRSHQAEVIFERRDVEGLTVQELLYRRGSKDVGAQAFEEWLRVAFVADTASWPDIEELAPKEVIFDGPNGERVLSLDFRPIDVEGRTRRIMMLASDETEKRQLQRTVRQRDEEHEKQMAAMRRLVAGGGQLLVSVLGRARDRLLACERLLESAPGSLDQAFVEHLFQHVHSVKGEARAFDLSLLESAAAELEDFLAILRGRLREGQRLELGQVRTDLERRLTAARKAVSRAGEMLVEASPIGEAILRQVTVQRDDVEGLVRVAGGRIDEIGALVNRLAARPFGELLLGLSEAVPRWAAREGKRAHIEVDGREVRVPAALARVLPDVLTHLVRNAVVHGIETTADRLARGKNEVGFIRVLASEGSGGPIISLEDDGRGLDEVAVLKRAKVLGFEGTDPASLVLEAGLSTANESESDLGGHGVGLGAVRADLASIGYRMGLRSDPNGFKVIMVPNGVPSVPSEAGIGTETGVL